MLKTILAKKPLFKCAFVLAGLLVFSMGVIAAEEAEVSNIEKTIEKSVEESVEKALEKAKKDRGKTLGDAVEKAIEKATEKATEITIEKAVEKAVEIAAGKPLEKEERPEKWRGPTKVHFYMFVIDIDKIDSSNQNFSANFYIKISWKDRRLAEKTQSSRLIPLEKIWSPRVILVNQGGLVWESLPKIAEVSPDGTVTYRQRYVGPVSQPLMLSNFPMDKHRFTIQFATGSQGSQGFQDVEFVPNFKVGQSGGAISEKLSVTDWEILSYEASSRSYEPISWISVPGFALEFTAKRYFLYYLWQVILPLSLIVMMSLAVLWIDRSNSGTQIGLATSAMLALITYRFILASLLPILPYMTRMDYFTLGSTLLVFLTLIEVIVASSLSRGKHKRLANNMDKFFRFAFPISFLLIFGWFMSGLWES